MSVSYKSIPDGMEFNTKLSTYILSFCIDTNSWFATNERFFYYEYPMDFPSEEAAIGYFKRNPDVFLDLEKSMVKERPSFLKDGVWMENTKELIPIK